MRYLNLGILAHVDAGKTTLTERLLYAAGIIDEVGRVDDGTTQTDSLDLERQRGITIKAAVVSFAIDDVTVNLIDTPGHPDFIAEVERVLNVLDGAVLVISAVEGVQPQTRILMRALQRLQVPTLIFVNKIDRRGADVGRVLREIAERLTPSIVAMGAVRDIGTRGAAFAPHTDRDAAFAATIAERVAEHDERLLAAFVDDGVPSSHRRLRRELARKTQEARINPVFFGSAVTGAGVEALMAGLTELLPGRDGNADGPLAGSIFKIERGPAGEKVAYLRLFSGTLRLRDRVAVNGEAEQKVTGIAVFDHGASVRRSSVAAGQIGKVWGLGEVRIGDRIGALGMRSEEHYFAPPTLETVVVPRKPADKGALHVALTQLAEQDPLINLRQDDVRQELFAALYGEVQKEVLQATLANDFGIDAEFRESTTICIERPVGIGSAVEIMGQEPNPFLATIGLRVEPAPVDTGIAFRLSQEVLGTMPLAFFKATEDTVRETLLQGLHGWQVTDCAVTMTHSGYVGKHGLGHQYFNKSMSSTGADFRGLTPLVVMSALKEAGTTVCEPMHRFHLEIPADTLGAVMPALTRLRAVPMTQDLRGLTYMLEGEIPAAHVHDLQLQLPPLTRGDGMLETAFDRYEPIRGVPPTRPRTDHNPLDRKAYLLHVLRRV